MAKDLSPILEDWPYEPGRINVRKIRGADNRIKIQMRVNLGLLQMEAEGRPDGCRPHNCESLLAYHEARIENYRLRNGTDLGFLLNQEECREIREEALQYYHRYLANFVLEEYEAVARDTQRNLRALDLCQRFAEDDEDRFALEQYRPYILMMNARSRALSAMQQGMYRTALAAVNAALKAIRDFFRRYGEPGAARESAELQVLRDLRREIHRHMPEDPVHRARRLLRRAIKEERYEDAARLRDELEALTRMPDPGP